MKPISFALIALCFLSGCSSEKKDEILTTEQLAQGLGVSWWVIEAPADIAKEDRAGLAYRLFDGTEKALGTSDGWTPGEQARVYSRKADDGIYRLRLVRKSGAISIELAGEDFRGRDSFFASGAGETRQFGDILAKMGKPDDAYSMGDALHEGQIGLLLKIEDAKVARIKNQKKMNPEDFIEAYEKALATQEWEAVDPLIHANCSVTFSNGHLHQGKDAVEKAFRRNFGLIKNETYAMTDTHWVVKTNDFAVYTFSFHWSGLIDGKHASGSGRGTSAIVESQGSWLLVAEHLGPRAQD